jgi:hypothetical protein
VQANEFLSIYAIVIVVLLLVLFGLTILRLMAVKQYHLKRTGEVEESMLASLGDKVSNTRWSLFDYVYLAIYILAISQGGSYLSLVLGYEILLIPSLVLAVVLLLVSVWFLQFTVRGKAYRRTEMILDDHQTLGQEDWVIRKHLEELIHEREGDNSSRAEIARATLENLKRKENRTGDTVRQILENPEQLRDIEPMMIHPSLLRFLRGSLLIFIVIVGFLLYFVLSYLSGLMSYMDLFMNALPISLLLILVLSLCLCVETPRARSASRKARLGI